MGVTTDADNDSAVKCTDCSWLGYVADAEERGGEVVCPDCRSEVEIA